MSLSRFVGTTAPADALIQELAALYPTNPLQTPSYAAARRSVGEETLLLALESGGRLAGGCLAFRRGRGGGHLEIPSAPAFASASAFWEGVRLLIDDLGVRSLYLGSFASTEVDLPRWEDEEERWPRFEWVLDLDAQGNTGALNHGHRRNVRRAREAGMELVVRSEPEALDDHYRCFESSMDRRAARGESVPEDLERSLLGAFLATGAGQLAQAFLDGQVMASLLFLRSSRGAYDQSSGTTAQGRKNGAAPFLIQSLCERLGAEGVQCFNLGGAQDDNPGLQAFKQGFGARRVELEAARFSTASGALNKLWELGRRAREVVSTRRAPGR
ncbi:MAG: GNAT family N-acetyltransferase [Gemmatimonadota bacterium]